MLCTSVLSIATHVPGCQGKCAFRTLMMCTSIERLKEICNDASKPLSAGKGPEQAAGFRSNGSKTMTITAISRRALLGLGVGLAALYGTA